MDKNLLFAILMSFATIAVLQYYASKNISQQSSGSDVQSGQSYKIPSRDEISKPLKLELDFREDKITEKERIVEVESDLWRATFSNYGGVLSSFEFKDYLSKSGSYIRSVHHQTFYQREDSSFLLAFDEGTPYFYEFEGQESSGESIFVSYVAKLDGWLVRKIYALSKNSYEIKVRLEFEKTDPSAQPLHPRLIFASPVVSDIRNNDTDCVVNDTVGDIVKVGKGSEFGQAWAIPKYFGMEDKYFLHIFLNKMTHETESVLNARADSSKSELKEMVGVTRGYFKKMQIVGMQAVLEFPEIKRSSFAVTDFYIGPKELDALSAVDDKLEDVLSFGWFSRICKLIVMLLKKLYNYLGSHALALILLILLVRIPFIPLSIYSATVQKRMEKTKAIVDRIKMKYRDDATRRAEEIMKFYRDNKISPLSEISVGCLPVLLQFWIAFLFTGFSPRT